MELIAIVSNVAALELPCGRIALIDAEHLSKVWGYPWCAIRKKKYWYVSYARNSSRKYLHNFLFPELGMIDHINRNPLDNRRINLRATDHSANIANHESYGLEYRSGHWQARVQAHYKSYSATFPTKELAVEWRRRKLIELHGWQE